MRKSILYHHIVFDRRFLQRGNNLHENHRSLQQVANAANIVRHAVDNHYLRPQSAQMRIQIRKSDNEKKPRLNPIYSAKYIPRTCQKIPPSCGVQRRTISKEHFALASLRYRCNRYSTAETIGSWRSFHWYRCK